MQRRISIAPYLLILPAIVVLTMTSVIPLIWLVRLSLFKTNFITSRFVGIAHYVTIFRDSRFLSALLNSGLLVIGTVPAITALGLCMAIMITWFPQRAHLAMRIVVAVPSMLAGMIIAASWRWIFHPQAGLVNWALSVVGHDPVQWFSTRWKAIGPVSVIQVLTVCGGPVVVYYAALKAVTIEMIESATIDGSTIGQIARYIQIPTIAATIRAMFIVNIIGSMQIFEWVYMLAPYPHSATMMYNIYHDGFLYSRHGQAAAESLVLMVICVVLIVAQRRIAHD